jgi:hypothetical protein
MSYRGLILITVLAASAAAFARKDESVQDLINRAESARLDDRPPLYVEIAWRQLGSADSSYQAGNSEAGRAAVSDVVKYSDQARDASLRSGKKLKDTEIALRKLAEKLRDVKRSLDFENQPPLQEAVDKLEKMRTELLFRMFPKKGAK